MPERVVVLGNRGGGKSTLARRLAARRGLLHVEIDRWLRAPMSVAAYDAEHAMLLARDGWVIDGLGRRPSIPARLARATMIVLVDLPLWMHAALPSLDTPPSSLPIEDIEREWMPNIRRLCAGAERRGAKVIRLDSTEALESFSGAL